jgi:hypothetical protein
MRTQMPSSGRIPRLPPLSSLPMRATSGVPSGDLLHGPEEIRAKWAEAIDPREANVQFDYELLAVTDTIGIARWMASYTYRRERKIVRYDGIFAVSLTGESVCNEFREWWNSREDPLES